MVSGDILEAMLIQDQNKSRDLLGKHFVLVVIVLDKVGLEIFRFLFYKPINVIDVIKFLLFLWIYQGTCIRNILASGSQCIFLLFGSGLCTDDHVVIVRMLISLLVQPIANVTAVIEFKRHRKSSKECHTSLSHHVQPIKFLFHRFSILKQVLTTLIKFADVLLAKLNNSRR